MAEVKQPAESKAPTATTNGYGVAAGAGDGLSRFGLQENVTSRASGPTPGVKIAFDLT
jgi:hypothetical protein